MNEPRVPGGAPARAPTSRPAGAGIVARPPLPLRAGLTTAGRAVHAMGRRRYLLADALGLTMWTLTPARRRLTESNHRRLDPSLDAAGAARRARDSYRQFARTGIDFLWANGMDDDEVLLAGRLDHGKWRADEARERGRGGIFTLTHFGNWDMAALIGHVHGMEMTTVMAETGPRVITDLVVWARQRNRLEVFEADRAARGLVRALRANRYVAMLADIPAVGPTTVVDYCGGPVVFSTVPAWLALRTGAALLPVACRRTERMYVLNVLDMIVPGEGDTLETLTQRVASCLEAPVRESPGHWYPFGPTFADERRPRH